MVGGDGRTFGNQTPCDPCDLSEQVSQQSAALSMTYQNTTGSALDVSFLLIAEATVSQGANVLYFPQPDVPVIPEPGTWALMGLGLLGLGWAHRRDHARGSNLTFRLVDLAPDNGIAPALTVRGDATATIVAEQVGLHFEAFQLAITRVCKRLNVSTG